MVDKLAITPSTYSRKEKGLVRMRPEERKKIVKYLNIPIEEVYESDETNYFVTKDQATANYLGTNHVYSISEYFLETQRKYIERLEKEIERLEADGFQMIHQTPKGGADGKRIAFLHPKSTESLLVELCMDKN